MAGLYGAGGGTGLYGAGSPEPSKKRKKRKKHEDHWYEKAIDKTVETAGGILGGLVQTGVSAVHDTWQVAERATGTSEKDDEYQLDDIGKAIIDDYKHRYTKDGNLSFEAWKDAWKTDPFAQVLDVASVAAAFFTFGGSLAVRGAGLASTGGRAAQIGAAGEAASGAARANRWAKFAGLDIDDDLTDLLRDVKKAEREHGKGSPEHMAAAIEYEGHIANIEAKARQLGVSQSFINRKLLGNASRVKEVGDHVLAPRRIALRDRDGIVIGTMPAAPSLSRRGFQRAGARINNSISSGPLSAGARKGRLDNRVNRIIGENEGASVFSPANTWSSSGVRKFRGLKPHEQTAIYLRSILGEANADQPTAGAGSKLEAYDRFLGAQMRQITGGSEDALRAHRAEGRTLDLAPGQMEVDRVAEHNRVYGEILELAEKEAKRLGMTLDEALGVGAPGSMMKPVVAAQFVQRVAEMRANRILHGEVKQRHIKNADGSEFIDEYEVPASIKETQERLEKLMAVLAKREEQLANGVKTVTVHSNDIVRHEVGPVDSSGRSLPALDENGKPIVTVTKKSERVSIEDEVARLTEMVVAVDGKLRRQHAAVGAYRSVARHLRSGGWAKFLEKQGRTANLAKVMRSPEYARKVLADLDARREVAGMQAVQEVFAQPTKRMLRVEKAIGEATGTGVKDGYTTRLIKDISGEGAVRANRPQMFLEMVLGRAATPEELARVNTWHHAERAVRAERGRRPKTSAYVRGNELRRPAQLTDDNLPAMRPKLTKFNTGYTFQYAQDMMSPKAIVKAYNEAQAYRAKMRILKNLRETSFAVSTMDEAKMLERTGNYYVIGPNSSSKELRGATKLADTARRIQDRLDNEMRLMIGGENPILDAASSELREIADLMTSQAGLRAIPKSYFNALTHELRNSENFIIRAINAPTALFRAATLNLRPAWIVNNFVGQMMLLLVGQGVYHGIREYMREIGRTLSPTAGDAVDASEMRHVVEATAAHAATQPKMYNAPFERTVHVDIEPAVRWEAPATRALPQQLVDEGVADYLSKVQDPDARAILSEMLPRMTDREAFERPGGAFSGIGDPYNIGFLFGSGRYDFEQPDVLRGSQGGHFDSVRMEIRFRLSVNNPHVKTARGDWNQTYKRVEYDSSLPVKFESPIKQNPHDRLPNHDGSWKIMDNNIDRYGWSDEANSAWNTAVAGLPDSVKGWRTFTGEGLEDLGTSIPDLKDMVFEPKRAFRNGEDIALWRGMSAEEMQSAMHHGQFRTHGTDNVQQYENEGDTNFSVTPEIPAYFARGSGHSRALIPSFGSSHYIIAVRTDRLPREKIDMRGPFEDKAIVKGGIPIESVSAVVEIRPFIQYDDGGIIIGEYDQPIIVTPGITWVMRKLDISTPEGRRVLQHSFKEQAEMGTLAPIDVASGAAPEAAARVTKDTRRVGVKVPSVKQQLSDKAGALALGAGSARQEYALAGRQMEKLPGMRDWTQNVEAKRTYKEGRAAGMSRKDAWKRAFDVTPGAPSTLAANSFQLWMKRGTVGIVDAMGKINSLVTDDMVRRAAFMAEVRPLMSATRRRMEAKGLKDLTDEQVLEVILSNDEATARLVDATMNDLIDFSRLSQTERDYIRPLLPFYSWMKGITLRTGRLIRDDPAKVNVMYQLGGQYVDDAEGRFGGPVPEYLKGALVREGEDGRPRAMMTHGMNVFQTPADILDMATQATIRRGDWKMGGLSPISQLNPVFKAPLEVMMGKDAFFGGPLISRPNQPINPGFMDDPWTEEDESTSRGSAAARRYLMALGPIQLYSKYAQDGGYRTLLDRDASDKALAYIGAPWASVNMDVAADRAAEGEQYGMVKYNPNLGEVPGVFGRERERPSRPQEERQGLYL